MHRDTLARFAIDLLEFIFRQKEIKLVVHSQGEDTAESTKQLAEDLTAITTVFGGNHLGKRAAEDRRGRKHAREEEEENLKKEAKKINRLPRTRKVGLYPSPSEMEALKKWFGVVRRA